MILTIGALLLGAAGMFVVFVVSARIKSGALQLSTPMHVGAVVAGVFGGASCMMAMVWGTKESLSQGFWLATIAAFIIIFSIYIEVVHKDLMSILEDD